MTRRTTAEYDWNALEFDETILTKHFTAQASKDVRYIVVHHMTIVGKGDGAALSACYRTWQSREASAHYGVDGKLVRQFVWDKDYAWATGNTAGNRYGISIEHANSTAGPKWLVGDETWKTGARLAAYLHKHYKMGRPVKDKTLRKHGSFTATACPGPYLGGTIWDKYVAEAQRVYDAIVKGTDPAPTPTPDPTPEPVGDSYVVQAGDTLYGISRKTGISVTNLAGWNNISDPSLISVGLRLTLKAPPAVPPAPQPTPDPEKPAIAQVRVLGENLWADYGASTFRQRLDELDHTRNEVRASIVLGCESGNYVDGQVLNRMYGWGGNRAGAEGVTRDTASYVLHSGNDVRISASEHLDPKKHAILDDGWWHTLPSSTHDGATWACVQNRESGVVFYLAVSHGIPWPIGPNDVRKWNNHRYDQFAGMFEHLAEYRAKTMKDRRLEVVPAIIGEDFNGLRTDSKYPGGDGPGRAMAKYGYADAYTLAKVRLPAGSPGRRPLIDRIGVSLQGVTVREHIVVPTRKGTDHPYAVAVALDLTNRKA